MTSFKEKLEDDALYQKKMKQMLRIKNRDEAWADEIESLHARRGVRALKSSAILEDSQRISLDSNIDNQAVRSRCVEIKIAALRQSITMTETIELLEKYLASKYSIFLGKKYKSVGEKKAAVAVALHKVVKVVDRLKLVMKLADAVIDDCDSAGYTLHRIGEVLESKAKERMARG